MHTRRRCLDRGIEYVEADPEREAAEVTEYASTSRGEAAMPDVAGERHGTRHNNNNDDKDNDDDSAHPAHVATTTTGLCRVLEALSCRLWPTDDTAPRAKAIGEEAKGAKEAEEVVKAETADLARQERERRAALTSKGRDAMAEEYMAGLAGAEPGPMSAEEKEHDELEKIFQQMSNLRLNGQKLGRGERQARAADLAMEMAKLIGEDVPPPGAKLDR